MTSLHSRPRETPPSTRTVVPVTYAARSEARKQTTSPNSRGVPEAAERDLRELVGRRPARAVELGHARRVDAPGRDAVDGDAFGAELARERLRPAGEHRGGSCSRARAAPTGSFTATDVMQTTRPASLCSQVREAEAHEADSGHEQQLERAASSCSSVISDALLAGGPPEFQTTMSMPPNASTVLPTSRSRSARVRDVSADGERADPLGVALELLAPPREHRRRSRPRPQAPPRRPGRGPTKLRRRSPSCRADRDPLVRDGSAVRRCAATEPLESGSPAANQVRT